MHVASLYVQWYIIIHTYNYLYTEYPLVINIFPTRQDKPFRCTMPSTIKPIMFTFIICTGKIRKMCLSMFSSYHTGTSILSPLSKILETESGSGFILSSSRFRTLSDTMIKQATTTTIKLFQCE